LEVIVDGNLDKILELTKTIQNWVSNQKRVYYKIQICHFDQFYKDGMRDRYKTVSFFNW
jgi:uncharacterized protein YqgV (UPF0045/DUF77 family)